MKAFTHSNALTRILHGIAALTLALVITGCSKQLTIEQDPFMEEWKAKAETSRPVSPAVKKHAVDLPESDAQADTKAAQQPSAEKAAVLPEKKLPTKKVTMNMRDTEANVLLRALAKIADQNIMMNDDVGGVTNVNVKNTPWNQVFLGVLHTRGLTYSWEGDIIRVMTLKDMQHDKAMADVKNERKSQEMISVQNEPLLTKIVKINYTDAAKLKVNLEKLLTQTQQEGGEAAGMRGSVNVDEHNNALIIQAVRGDIAEIVALIDELDMPTLQVLIEAHIVETTRDTARELGIQWGGLHTGGHGHHQTVTGSHTMTNPTTNPTPAATNTITHDAPLGQSLINFPINDAGLPRAGEMALGVIAEKTGNYLLDVQLKALEAQSKLNILSSPSITTLDNQKAIIESGAKVPFQTVDNTGQTEIEFEDAVLRLEVTPHVIGEENLRLSVITTKDEVDFTRTVQGNPTIIKKRAETNIILRDGQTSVIGGLTKETSSGSESGVPTLKDVPGFGRLFKGEGNSIKMEEVLIFITPHIIKSSTTD